jgi:BarA-like signal transduction histidine kinase
MTGHLTAFKINNYNLNKSQMELGYMNTLPQESGFNYDNCLRNMALTNNKGMGM